MRFPHSTERSQRPASGLNALSRAVGHGSGRLPEGPGYAEELLAGLSVLCGLGIFKATTDGRIIHANSQMEEIWQLPAGQLAGSGWVERIHPEDAAYAARIWNATIGNGQPYSCRYRLLLPDGTIRQIFARAIGMQAWEQNSAVVVGTVEDITAEVDLQYELRMRRAEHKPKPFSLEVDCRLHPKPAEVPNSFSHVQLPDGRELVFLNEARALAAWAITFDCARNELSVWNAGNPPALYVDDRGLPSAWTKDIARRGFLLLWTQTLQDTAQQLSIEPLTLAVALQLPDCRLAPENPNLMSACIHLPGARCPLNERWVPLLDVRYGREMCRGIDELQSAWARNLEFAIPGLRDASLFDILLCTREAVLNGLIHGCPNGGVTRLSILYNCALSKVTVRVSDPGIGHSFDAHIHDCFELLDQHRGLYLIRQFAQQVVTERNGATIQMSFDLNPEPAAD
jgi:PAS domain S-box-containing protein